MGSAPHQGACADLNRGCAWACRRLRRACSCSLRVSSASCGVHCASTSNVLRRASTGTNVLGASACSLCRTCCYRNRWLRFSPCRAHRLHLHLWWSTSRRRQQFMLHLRLSRCTSRWHKQCLTPRKHKYWSTSRLRLEHMPDLLQLQQGVHSLPVVPTVYICTCGGVHRAGTSSLCCTCACHGVPRAGTSSVLRRASTSTGVLRACVLSICRTFCNCNREFILSLSCPLSTFALVVEYFAPSPQWYAAPRLS